MPKAPKHKSARAARKPSHSAVIYENLADYQMDLEDVAQGAVRVLAYDPDATQQFIDFLARVAGLPIGSLGDVDVSRGIKKTVAALESAASSAPAAYPLGHAKFRHRFDAFFAPFVQHLLDSQSADALVELLPFIQKLAAVHLRSLRHVAVSFSAQLARSLREYAEQIAQHQTRRQSRISYGSKTVERLITGFETVCTERALDVSPEIRETAVQGLPPSSPALKELLNDESALVRVAALGAIDPELAPERVLEIAQKDVDSRCRIAAVPLVPVEEQISLLSDPEQPVCYAAAVALKSVDLDELIGKVHTFQSIKAIARAHKLSVEDALAKVEGGAPLLLLLAAAEYTSHSTNADRLAHVTSVLVNGFAYLLEHKSQEFDSLIQLFCLIDLDAALSRSLESDVFTIFQEMTAIFIERPESAFAEACAHIFKNNFYQPKASHILTNAFEELLLSKARMATKIRVSSVFGRWIDVSEIVSPELWSSKAKDLNSLAAALAFHAPREVVEDALNYLINTTPLPSETILQVLIVAKVRDLPIDVETPKIPTAKVSKRILEAAKAAEVLC